METCWDAASAPQHSRCVNMQHCRWHRVAAETRTDCRCRLRWQLVNFFGGADVPRQAPVRPARRDETLWTPPDLRRGRGSREEDASSRRGPREDLGCRRMDVDWDQQNGICFTHPHTHTHTHTHMLLRYQYSERSCNWAAFFVYLFFLEAAREQNHLTSSWKLPFTSSPPRLRHSSTTTTSHCATKSRSNFVSC